MKGPLLGALPPFLLAVWNRTTPRKLGLHSGENRATETRIWIRTWLWHSVDKVLLSEAHSPHLQHRKPLSSEAQPLSWAAAPNPYTPEPEAGSLPLLSGLRPHLVSSSTLVTASLPMEGVVGPGPHPRPVWLFLEVGYLGNAWDSLRPMINTTVTVWHPVRPLWQDGLGC